MNKINKIKQLLGIEVKLEQRALSNGAVLEAEAFEPGQPVFVVAEDEQIPVPAGEYEMEDGSVLIVAEDGIIGEIKQAGEEPEEEVMEESVTAEAEVAPKKVVESVTKESHFSDEQITELADLVFNKLEERLETYTLKVEEKEGDKELTEKIVEELKAVEVEAAEEIETRVHTPENQTKVKELKISTNKPQTIKDRVFAKLSQ